MTTHVGIEGASYYAKPDETSDDPSWDADAIALNPNAVNGKIFTFTPAAGVAYIIYERAGLEPAVTDDPIGLVPASVDYSSGTNGTGEVQILVSATRSTDDAAVRNVRVTIENTDTHDTTGTLGLAELNVDPNELYTLIVTPPSGYENVDDIEVSVGAVDEPVDIVLVPTTVEVLAAPLCNVTLPTPNQYGANQSGVSVTIKFNEFNAGAVPTGVVVNLDAPLKSNSDGYVLVPLLRFGNYTASYRIGKERPKEVTFDVPDAGSYQVVES